MIQELGKVTLENGQAMTVKLLTPPAAEYEDAMVHFLGHKRDESQRSIRQRLRGDYATFCEDRYFLGEIGGEIAGQLWYGYARGGWQIANFGHVYTHVRHRKKGVTNVLMRFFLDDFNARPVRAALCGTGSPWVAAIYLRHGFRAVVPAAETGPLILLKNEYGADFCDFEARYFAPGQTWQVGVGTMEQRHDVDLVLRDALFVRNLVPPRVGMASRVSSYQTACFLAEDGQGLVTVAGTDDGRALGWAFLLNTGSALEAGSKVFGFEIHPDYAAESRRLVRESLALACDQGMQDAYAYLVGTDVAKLQVLTDAGFREVARLAGYCVAGGAPCDLVVLRVTQGS
ncbi:MAG: hypothetical protein A3K18_31835 [Lentisphaerae bacterium RIFOXYA12_64_32]|nr:MAG: hypothetical protein A3K18_31835 [Lentisphaerae bacterium RIFOXYA12_64_32]